MLKMSQLKRIPISEEKWKELGDIKQAGQTWDDLIGELLEEHKKAKMFEMIEEREENDEFVSLSEI